MKGAALVGAGIAGSAMWIAILVPLWGLLGYWALAIPGGIFVSLLVFGLVCSLRPHARRRRRISRANRAHPQRRAAGAPPALTSPGLPQPAEP